MTQVEPIKKIRPAWLSDAKWVVGILAFFVVAATALVAGVTKLTEREPAITLMTTVIATLYSPGGLDETASLEPVKQAIAASPTKSFKPFPGVDVAITAEELEGKSPRALRLELFRALAEPIYDKGTFTKGSRSENLDVTSEKEERAAGPSKAEQIGQSLMPTPTAENVGALVFLSRESHERVLDFQKIMLGVSAGLLLLLSLTSVGFGRLASPGWVLVLVSALPAGLIFFVEMSLTSHPPAAPSGEPTLQGMASSVGVAVAPLILAAFKNVYQPLALTGAGLVGIATLGGISWNFAHRSRVV
jgi:hypothetical protein